MNKKKTINIVIMLFSITLFISLVSATDWWNNDWNKRQQISINENSGTTLTDFSILLTIPYTLDMKPDFSDLRFVDSTNTNELSFWIENKANSGQAKIWVKVPSIQQNSQTSIFMYYNNLSASSTSNFNNAFLYADDFETNTLDRYIMTGNTCDGVSINGGKLVIDYQGNNLPCTIAPNFSYQKIQTNYTAESSVAVNNDCAYSGVVGYLPGTLNYADGGVASWMQVGLNKFGLDTWATDWINPILYLNLFANTYYETELMFSGDLQKATLDNIYSSSRIDNNPLGGYYGVVGVYEGCNAPAQTSVEWFRVRPSVSVAPTTFFGSPEDKIQEPPVDNNLTGRVTVLETKIAELQQTVILLQGQTQDINNKDQEQDGKITLLESGIADIQSLVNNFINKITIYLSHLKQNDRKDMLCGYLKEKGQTSINDLGLHCEVDNKGKCSCN